MFNSHHASNMRLMRRDSFEKRKTRAYSNPIQMLNSDSTNPITYNFHARTCIIE